MRKTKIGIVILVCLFLIVLGACAQPTPETPPEEAPGAAPDDVAEPDTAGQDPEMVAAGEEVVRQACIGCHGSNLEGTVGPSLIGVRDKYTEEELRKILINGTGSMPGGTVRGQEDEVVAYLLTLE